MKLWFSKKKEILALMLCIALLPPLWAVLSPYLGITTGSVSLICAGIYVAGGNSRKNGIKMSVGFLCGDLWAVLVVLITGKLNLNPDLELFACLFLLGALAVFLSDVFQKIVYLPAWLCGWAVGITIMAPLGPDKLSTLPLQIGVSMLVGVWYVGEGVRLLQSFLCRRQGDEPEGRSPYGKQKKV